MQLDEEGIKQLRIKLALEGTGAKGKFAKKLKCAPCQVSNLIRTGYIPDIFKKRFLKALK